MVYRACECGGRITRVKGESVCDKCGPIKPYATSAIAPVSDRSPYHASQRWREEAERFKNAHPYCAVCIIRGVVNGRRGRRGLLVDHIIPARLLPGGLTGEAFWDRKNWQVICLDCDLTHKKPIERECGEDIKMIIFKWNSFLMDLRRKHAEANRNP